MSDDLAEKPAKSHGRLRMQVALTPRDLMAEPQVVQGAWQARVVTLLPDAFPGILGQSLTGKALDLGLWSLGITDLRTFGIGKHRNVDDTPAGGGAGMVLRADVVDSALSHAVGGTPMDRARWPVIYLSPRGRRFDQAMARRWAAAEGVTLLCGRFEGVDQRVLDHWDIEEVSLGDFVMTGGELAAQAMLDAAVRLLPGVLGNADSAVEESFSQGLLEHPHYTRPAQWQDLGIPAVLQSGNHAEIARWRAQQSLDVTAARRPDLWAAHLAARPPQKRP